MQEPLQRSVLVKALEQYAENPDQKENLLQSTDEVEKKLNRTYRNFQRQLKENPLWIRESCLEETEAVHRLFKRYFEVLEKIRKLLPGQENARELQGELTEIIGDLNRAFLSFREAVLISWGPFEHSGINFLIAMAFKVKAGEGSVTEVTQEIGPLLAAARACLPAVKQSGPMAAWLESYISLLEGHSEITVEKLEVFIEELHCLGNRHYAMNLAKTAQQSVSDQSVLSLADFISECAELYQREYLPPEMFAEILGAFHTQLLQIQSLLPLPADAERKEEKQNLSDATDTAPLEEALEILFAGLENCYGLLSGAGEEAEFPGKTLQEGAEKFRVAMQHLELLSQREGKIPCMRCGSYSAAGRFCEKCNAPLPPIPTETLSAISITDSPEEEAETVMTVNIGRLFTAAEKYCAGECAETELETETKRFEQLLLKAEKIGSAPDGGNPATDEAFESYRQGLGEIGKGLKKLQMLAGNGDMQLLEKGMQQIWSGAGMLQSMQKKLKPYLEMETQS